MISLIALGSNLGDREFYLNAALRAMAPLGTVVAVSPIYETEPVGCENQPRFLNAVCALETQMTPEVLLENLLRIEDENGRRRAFKNAPRTLDLDLLFCENLTRMAPTLTLPHPRIFERAFVCLPLNDILEMTPLCENEFWNILRLKLKEKMFVTGIARWHNTLNWKKS